MSSEKQETSTYKLSVLIPTLEERKEKFEEFKKAISQQIWDNGAFGRVEVIHFTDNRERTTGDKRNYLIERAKGEYVVFFDDDDIPQPNYIKSILEAIEYEPDVIPINGFMTTDGHSPVYWEMGLGYDYCKRYRENGTMYYERFPNHIAPMRRELIKDFKFKDITVGEDYEWAKRINDAGVLKTQYRITEAIYHYDFKHK